MNTRKYVPGEDDRLNDLGVFHSQKVGDINIFDVLDQVRIEWMAKSSSGTAAQVPRYAFVGRAQAY
ncbi:hypothetical protein GS491_27130 [Rhodococcus hoagii]|nr:hypothetical protein [Prescottella equi]